MFQTVAASPVTEENNYQNVSSIRAKPAQQLTVTEDGRSLRVQTDLPHLVSLGGGRLSTAVTLLPLPEGKTRIGTANATTTQDVVLQGAGIEPQHCYIVNDQDVVTLVPLADLVTIDGLRVTTPTRLLQGCMVGIGRCQYFRFNHPLEAQRLRSQGAQRVNGAADANFYPEESPYDNNMCNYTESVRCPDNGVTSSDQQQMDVSVYDNVTNINSVRQERRSRRDVYLDNGGGWNTCSTVVEEPSEDGTHADGPVGTNADYGSEPRPDLLVFRRTSDSSGNHHGGPDLSPSGVGVSGQPDDAETCWTKVQEAKRRSSLDRPNHHPQTADVNAATDSRRTSVSSSTDQDAAKDGRHEAVSLTSIQNGHPEQTSGQQRGDDSITGSEHNPPWNGYDNIAELKEAIHASAAAKMAKLSALGGGKCVALPRPMSGGSATTSSGGRRDQRAAAKAAAAAAASAPSNRKSVDGDSGSEQTGTSHRSGVVCERIADIRQQRLSACRELATAAHGVQTSATSTSSLTSSSSSSSPTSSSHIDERPTESGDRNSKTGTQTDAGPTTAPTTTSDDDRTTENGDETAQTDGRRGSAGQPENVEDDEKTRTSTASKKKTVSFDDDAKTSTTAEPAADGGKRRKQKSGKPPIGKTNVDGETKKKEKKSKKDKKTGNKVEATPTSATQETETKCDGQPTGKMSFFRSLLSRSRSPSPKPVRHQRTPSPSGASSSGDEIVKRISDPLKASAVETSPSVKKKQKKTSKKGDKLVSKLTIDLTKSAVASAESSSNDEMKSSRSPDVPDSQTAESTAEQSSRHAVEGRSEDGQTSSSDNVHATSGTAADLPEPSDATLTRRSRASTTTPPEIQSATLPFVRGVTPPDGRTASSTLPPQPPERRSMNVVSLRRDSGGVSPQPQIRHSGGRASSTSPGSSNDNNPWVVNLKELNLRPNLDNFEGEKVFQKGTATTRLVLPGFGRSTPDVVGGLSTVAGRRQSLEAKTSTTAATTTSSTVRQHPGSNIDSSPIYDTVYEDRPTLDVQGCRSSLRLPHGGGGGGGSSGGSSVQRNDSIGKSYSLQDIKSAAGSGRVLQRPDSASRTTRNQLQPEAGESAPSFSACTVPRTPPCVRVSDLTSLSSGSKTLKSVKFREDVGSSCTSRLPLTDRVDGIASRAQNGAPPGEWKIRDGYGVEPTDSPDADAHQKLSKCSSLPPYSKARAVNQVGGESVVTAMSTNGSDPNDPTTGRNGSASNRDTVAFSFCLDELSGSQQDLADLYRLQKTERKREQEAAQMEKERLERIEKLWKEFECPSKSAGEDPAVGGGRKDRGTMDEFRPSGSTRNGMDRGGETTAERRPKHQIEKSFDELLEEFNLTARETERTRRRINNFELHPEPVIPEETNHVHSLSTSKPYSIDQYIPTDAGCHRKRDDQRFDVDAAETGAAAVRPRASSYGQNVRGEIKRNGASITADKSRSQTLLRPNSRTEDKTAARSNQFAIGSGYSSDSSRNCPKPKVHEHWHNGDFTTSSSEAEDNSSSSHSTSPRVLLPNEQLPPSPDKMRYRMIDDQLKAVQEQVRRKQAAIRALEAERERCMELERRLQQLKNGAQRSDESDHDAENGQLLDAGKIQHSRQSSEDRELSPPSTTTTTTARPLTRYLPVRESKDLDLRQFVEAAGHNLAQPTCNVEVTSTTCHGYLSKSGRKFGGWKRRWFVFDRSRRCLNYYVDKIESTRGAARRGAVYFQSIQDVFVDHRQTVRSPNPTLTFCVKTVDRMLFLMAPTPEAMRIWIDVIFTGAEGYQQFL